MNPLDEHRSVGQLAWCQNCGRHTITRGFRHPITTERVMQLCFICGNTPGAVLQENAKPVFAAMSLVIDTLKPPKKPRQPKDPIVGPSVHPMKPRRK